MDRLGRKIKKEIGMNKINAGLSVVDQGLVSATNFGVAFVLARTLPVEKFGLYVLMFSIWFFVNNLQMGFINHGLYVLTHSENIEYRYNMPLVQFMFSVVILSVLLIGSFIYSLTGSILSFGSMAIFSISIFFLTLKEYARNAELAEINVLKVTCYDLFFLFGVMSLTGLQYKMNTVSLSSAWMNFALVSFMLIAIDIFLSPRYRNCKFSKVKSVFKTNYSFTKWTTITHILGWINGHIYKYFIVGVLGIAMVGAIGACEYVVFLVNPILNGLQNYGVAILSKKKKEGVEQYKQLYKKYSLYVIFLMSLILLPVISSPEFFLKLFYNDKFLEYKFLLQVFAVNVIINVFGRLYWMKLLVNAYTKHIYLTQLIVFVVTIPLLIILLPLWGIKGFIAYWFALNAMTFLTSFYYVRKLNAV